MFSNSKISTRLLVLIVVQVLVLSIIAITGIISLNSSTQTMSRLNNNVTDQNDISRLGSIAQTDIVNLADELFLGSITWEEGKQQLLSAQANFDRNWQEYLASLSADEAEFVEDIHGLSLQDMNTVFNELKTIINNRDRGHLSLFMTNDFSSLVNPYFEILQARSTKQQRDSDQLFQQGLENNQLFLLASIIIGIIGALIAATLGVFVYRSISRPINQISDTVQKISEGDYEARTLLTSNDELGQLGQTVDRLLQDRLSSLAEAQQENEALNASIIQLLQGVFQLSQRDLTVKIPVTEDVTGPVADALNLLTNETSKVLTDVTRISQDVATVSNTVKSQSDKVISLADIERQEVERTTDELQNAAQSMNHIAELAQACNNAADDAIKTTETALQTVTNTVSGINSTRDTIRETEKRIKRLGERSQEISGIVNIINTIAERTHILALNASMHAASAGEAGRGFAVVANEVQRLAENAREATSQIATLVGNIQTETADTVNAMNQAISQVVDGSRLAEQAGEQMRDTQSTTSELVAAVQQIATNSQQQAEISNRLLQRAAQIQQSTQQTSDELQQQGLQTVNLVQYANGLVDAVQVFKLPEAAQQSVATESDGEDTAIQAA